MGCVGADAGDRNDVMTVHGGGDRNDAAGDTGTMSWNQTPPRAP